MHHLPRTASAVFQTDDGKKIQNKWISRYSLYLNMKCQSAKGKATSPVAFSSTGMTLQYCSVKKILLVKTHSPPAPLSRKERERGGREIGGNELYRLLIHCQARNGAPPLLDIFSSKRGGQGGEFGFQAMEFVNAFLQSCTKEAIPFPPILSVPSVVNSFSRPFTAALPVESAPRTATDVRRLSYPAPRSRHS